MQPWQNKASFAFLMFPMAFKLLIAPDKFKGTLTSDDVAAAIASGRNPAGDNPWNRVADLLSSLAPIA
jgi:hypothetical protein